MGFTHKAFSRIAQSALDFGPGSTEPGAAKHFFILSKHFSTHAKLRFGIQNGEKKNLRRNSSLIQEGRDQYVRVKDNANHCVRDC
jgi:hypothetical protein